MAGKKTSRQKRSGLVTRRRPQVVIAIALALSLFAALTLLGTSGAFNSALTEERKKGHTVSPASLNSNSPSKEYVYAGGRLVATEEPASSSCVSPPSPGNTLFATAQTETSVELNWAPSSGADHYEVQRRQSIAVGSDWATLSPNPGSNTFTDNGVGVVANTAYLYRVRAVDAAGACPSAYSNVDLATTIIFVDVQLQGQFIKAQHVTQLRQAVDAVRVTANIGPAAWTNPLDQVSAVHFSELRARLNDALLDLGSLGFSQMPTDPEIAQGNTVRAVHLQLVRDKVK